MPHYTRSILIILNHFKIAFNNCRSHHKHFPQVKTEPNILALDVVAFSETKLCSAENNYQLHGYTAMFIHEVTDQLNRRPHHGTVLYVNNKCKATHISKFNNGSMEFISANVHFSQTAILFFWKL